VQSAKPHIRGNAELLTSKNVWDAGGRWYALIWFLTYWGSSILGNALFGGFVFIPILNVFSSAFSLFNLACLVITLGLVGNHLFSKSSFSIYIKYNRIRDYRRRVIVDVTGKRMPAPEALLDAVAPCFIASRALVSKNSIIVIGNSHSSITCPIVKRVYFFIFPFEGGVKFHAVGYPLLTFTFFKPTGRPTSYWQTSEDYLKDIMRKAFRVLPDG
jgi:hypothetical protein